MLKTKLFSMKKIRKYYKSAVLICLIFFAGIFVWNKIFSPTKIALLNFPDYQFARMSKSLDNRFVKLYHLDLEDISSLEKYDAVIIFAMGIRLTDEDRDFIKTIADNGKPVISVSATDPMNRISSIDDNKSEIIIKYLSNAGTENYRSVYNYIRKEVLGKKLFTGNISAPKEISSDILFHLDDEVYFESTQEYKDFYHNQTSYNPSNPSLAIVLGMGNPYNTNKDHINNLIKALEQKNINVYPISSVQKRFEFIEEINPDAVVYLPHGRFIMADGDKFVEWLKQKNIPMFCPLTVNIEHDEWLKDKQGMVGGFLSQSIAMPEIDGGILSMSLNALYRNKEGLYLFNSIQGKLEQFVSTISNYLNLRVKNNADKKIAIYYYRGPGNSSMVAAGLEVIPSLFATLNKLKDEGYHLGNLPNNLTDFEEIVMNQGIIYGPYAKGKIHEYLNSGLPEFVSTKTYLDWLKISLNEENYDILINRHGFPPGDYYTKDNSLAVTRIQFGNVVILPQPIQGTGETSFAMVHGDNPIPPHHYIASYLWVQYGFKADAMIHFGTHGSLEFIPGKQVALSNNDWTDRLVGDLPHFYIYTINNVGEAIIAKRRSYATILSHLNPPFMESGIRQSLDNLFVDISLYLSGDEKTIEKNLKIKETALELGLHRDLKLDSIPHTPYSDDDILKIENFAEEISTEKITSGLYALGTPFTKERIVSSTKLLSLDPIAYNLAQLDLAKGIINREQFENNAYFNQNYRKPAENIVSKIINNPNIDIDAVLKSIGITKELIESSQKALEENDPIVRMRKMIQGMSNDAGKTKTDKKSGHNHAGMMKKHKEGDHSGMPKSHHAHMNSENKPHEINEKELEISTYVIHIKNAVENVSHYKSALLNSPQLELEALINGLNGGYISPSPGGDFIANPNTLPTGRNIFSINVEATPSPLAWKRGVKLAEDLLQNYLNNHGHYPEKVSFTLWGGSFIASEGTTIAQILYLLGVEPVRDQFNRVLDVKLIPEEELGRPRIDVVIQTSGQLRDIAASRLSLIQKAIEMAASANDKQENYVRKGLNDAERILLEKGFSPKEARTMSSKRIFGGMNGMYGTGITTMVESGDKWEEESEISKTYINNMGAYYGSEEDWGVFNEGLFEAALQNTSVVVQPRQSNTWGALSLDHVYEFMGGLSLAVRNVTGKDPDAYFNDYRNRHNLRVQDLKSAIGVEARTTIFNPNYIEALMEGGASSANVFASTIRNTYGWNVMKPAEIDNEMWDEIYNVYVKDIHNLNIHDFFENESPAALQEITAVMMETSRKGYWDATPQQLMDIANLHTELVKKYDAACSGFVCDNMKLKDYIEKNASKEYKTDYLNKINEVRNVNTDNSQSVTMERQDVNKTDTKSIFESERTSIIVFSLFSLLALAIYIIYKRKTNG
jgi:cobaltochelatase CobN